MNNRKGLNENMGKSLIIVMVLLTILLVYVSYSDAKQLKIETELNEFTEQQDKFRAELCKDYFLKLGNTEYIVLDEPEFYIRNDNEYVCTIKLGYNCSGKVTTTKNKTFAMNICEKVAYAGLNMDIIANETLTGSEIEKIEWYNR